MQKHPRQPVEMVKDVLRFKENKIVSHLLAFSAPLGCGMNELARQDFSIGDRRQFAQLIGYSVSGYDSLSYSEAQHSQVINTELLQRICNRDALGLDCSSELEQLRTFLMNYEG